MIRVKYEGAKALGPLTVSRDKPPAHEVFAITRSSNADDVPNPSK